ncbi:MAG: hypothetical protein QM667_04535 [Asticcacaulis sp.]
MPLLKWLNAWTTPPFEELTNARLHDLMHATVERLLPEGFEAAGELKWVRDTYAPVRHVFGFTKYKGGILRPYWGLSLDFVPHVSGKQIRWHRSNATARPDLHVPPRDPALSLPYIHGERPVRRGHPTVVTTAITRAEPFWSNATTIESLPQAIAGLRAYLHGADLGFYNYTQHALTAAFVHAQNGNLPEALSELAHHSVLWDSRVYQDLQKRLEDAFVRRSNQML